MLALAFSFSVFVYWVLLGRALISAVYPRIGVLRGWLLAPSLGLATVLLALMVLNQAGIPIKQFAGPLTVVLGVASVGLLAWRRPMTPIKTLLPYVLAVVFSIVWTGWPAFETGFNWISYANDDMANYCLAAQRFMDHGFYSVPTMADLAGRDYASYYFFMHVADMMRFGSEHLVAWGASIGHVQATQAFMPVIVALGLVQIFSVGAVVLNLGRWRRQALLTVWLLAASPLFMLGTLYQLIAQVGGIALLLATITLLLRPWGTSRRPTLIRYAILPTVTSAALCIDYPEVTPFAVLTFGGFTLLWALRHRAVPKALLILATYTLLGVVIVLRHNLISYISILIVQSGGALNAANLLLSLFPYFMIPTGFSNLFGWMPISHDFPEPIVSISIVAGMILMAATLGRALRQTWRLSPVALLLLLQFALAVRLFDAANDFGLYKLAMWMQPALAAGVASVLLWLLGRRTAVLASVMVTFAVTTLPTAFFYTNASRGLKSGGLTEMRLASQLGLQPTLPADKNAQLTSTIENVVAAKFAAAELRGYPLSLVSRDYFFPTTRWDYAHPTWPILLQPHFKEMSQALPLIEWRNHTLIEPGILWRTQFTQTVSLRPTDYYVSVDPRLSLFNKFDDTPTPPHHGVFVIEPAASVHNRVIFVHSWLGNHYYLGDRRRIAFFQQEADLFAPGHQFNGIGRFLLLRIDKASPQIYLRVSATRTLVTGRTAWSPRSVVRAATDVPLGAVGNGAFNLFVGPLTPEVFDGVKYVAIDFAEYPKQLTDYRPGLKRLYHQSVALDYRRLLGWARDISAISEAEYAAIPRPRSIGKFPDDLALARSLEFSGAYEDGWLSPHARFVLDGAHRGEFLRFRGVVPGLEGQPIGTGVARVTINGDHLCDLPMPPGRFDWLLPVPPGRTTTIDLQFSAVGTLAGRDGRPVGAKLDYLGFADTSTVIDCNYDAPYEPRLPATGIDQDGWMRRTASLLIPASTEPTDVTLQFEYPNWGHDAAAGMLHARIDGTRIAADAKLSPGTRPSLRLHLPAAAGTRVLLLDAPAEFTLPSPDSRHRALRVTNVRISPAPTT